MGKAPARKINERKKGAQQARKVSQHEPARLPEEDHNVNSTSGKTSGAGTSYLRPVKLKNTCQNCLKLLSTDERAVFVEEENSRIFCSEKCISHYFIPEVECLEKEFFKHLSPDDFDAEEREKLSHLRWATLQEPNEAWRNISPTGDYHYTLISEFEIHSKHVWTICICLFLRGQPSFLFLAFPTQNPAMVDTYRTGEKVHWSKKTIHSSDRDSTRSAEKSENSADHGFIEPSGEPTDRLAEAWTEEETILARLNQERSKEDIPLKDFELYGSCLEETLEKPHEVWSSKLKEDESQLLYHFIRHYPHEDPGVWFIVVARESKEDEQIEILNAFPTKDLNLVNRYRTGSQELGNVAEESESAKTLH